MVRYTCDVVKATLHRVLPISPGSSSRLPHLHLNLRTARLLDSTVHGTFLDCYLHLDCSTPVLDLLSSPPRTQIGCHLLLEDLPLPRLASLLCSMTSCLSIFPVISLCPKLPVCPALSLSLGRVITHMDLRLRRGTQTEYRFIWPPPFGPTPSI